MPDVGVSSATNQLPLRKPSSIRQVAGRVGAMKNIDIKSLIIGALFTSTVLLGMGAVSGPASTTLKLDGPIDLRLGFGGTEYAVNNL